MFVPYIHARIRAHALSQAWPDAPSSDRRRKAWDFLMRLESIHSTLTLLNFVTFLWNGRLVYACNLIPALLVPSFPQIPHTRRSPVKAKAHANSKGTSRDVSYEFMNRQMVWHAFTVSIQYILSLSLIPHRTCRNSYSSYFP